MSIKQYLSAAMARWSWPCLHHDVPTQPNYLSVDGPQTTVGASRIQSVNKVLLHFAAWPCQNGLQRLSKKSWCPASSHHDCTSLTRLSSYCICRKQFSISTGWQAAPREYGGAHQNTERTNFVGPLSNKHSLRYGKPSRISM